MKPDEIAARITGIVARTCHCTQAWAYEDSSFVAVSGTPHQEVRGEGLRVLRGRVSEEEAKQIFAGILQFFREELRIATP